MRPWATRSRPQRPERPRRAAALASLAGLGLLLLAGCVTRGTHEEAVAELEAEKQRLAESLALAERSNQSLAGERARLIDEMEDLRLQREQLERDVAKLRRSEEILSEHLRKREQRVAELVKVKGTYEGLVADLEQEVSAGQIQIEQLREGLRLNLTQQILFPSGSAKLDAAGVRVLRKVASRLGELPHAVEVQGHTDDVPVSADLARRFPSNWELAAARAIEVVRLLASEKLAPERLRAVSYGETRPIASNETPEGRARNRRIEIRLSPLESPPETAPAATSP